MGGQPSETAVEIWWERICCFVEEFEAIGLRIPGCGAADIQVDFTEKPKILGTEAQRRKSSGQKGSIAGWFSILNLMSLVLMLQNLRAALRKKHCNKNGAPAEMHWKWRNMSTSSKKRTKPHSTRLQKEVWSLPAPSSTKPVERELVVDSRASMHMLSKKDLNLVELETVQVSRISTTVITAKGEVESK